MATHFEAGRGYRYDFRLYGQRYRAPRGFPTKQESVDAEAALRRRIRRVKAGLEVAAVQAPTFTDCAGVYLVFAKTRLRLRSPETVEAVLKAVLRFWGAKPEKEPAKPAAGAPYHDLRLSDPITDPSWILKFEQWMHSKGLAASTKNHYRVAMSRMYAMSMLPEYRQQSGIVFNPFRGILRDQPVRRITKLTDEQLRRLITHAAPHLQLAIRIGLYAPKLRRGNILALRWGHEIDDRLTTITVADHKILARTQRPLVTIISKPLRRHLTAAKRRQPKGVPWVIHHEGAPVKTLRTAMEGACERAGIPYGIKTGVTFHSLRHTAATMLASLNIAQAKRKMVMGHLTDATAAGYTHLAPHEEREPLAKLGRRVDRAFQGKKSPRNSPRRPLRRSA